MILTSLLALAAVLCIASASNWKINSGDIALSSNFAPVSIRQSSASGSWRTISTNGALKKRHEACAVMVSGKVYLIGGRGGKRTVDVYTPATKTWSSKKTAPQELHHMQCVAYKNRYVYIAGAWFGGFPKEKAHGSTYVYDTTNDSWRTEPGLGARARGAGATAFYKGKLYLAMGNRGGHGAHATTLGEFDVYNPGTKVWSRLPSAPDARDHVGGGIIGNYFCIAGGRNGGVSNFWKKPVTRVNCYNFSSGKWERKANLPEGRGGAATGTTCGGLLMIAGGEGIPPGQSGRAFNRVDLYDVRTNTFRAPSFLKKGRHGTGLAISDCSCGNIYYPSGSGGLGGGPELTTTEVWRMSGGAQDNC